MNEIPTIHPPIEPAGPRPKCVKCKQAEGVKLYKHTGWLCESCRRVVAMESYEI